LAIAAPKTFSGLLWSRPLHNLGLELLPTQWWEEMDLAHNAGLARIFAGWYWGKPACQNGFLLGDDSRQGEIYQNIPASLQITWTSYIFKLIYWESGSGRGIPIIVPLK
jgi:hypothetical protein